MWRQYLLSIIALIGAMAALLVVMWSQRKEPVAPVLFPPPISPYEHAIYGAGMIEASSENIAIGTPFLLPITQIFVLEGDKVHAGDPLLQLDTRTLDAQKEMALSQLNAAIVNLENVQTQFSFYERLTDKRAVSEQAYMQAYYAMKEAEEQVKVCEASLKAVETDIKRTTICAPVDGEILQVNAHIGEIYPPASYATTLPYINSQSALIFMGTVAPLQMRIDIDEEDCWRFQKGAKATAFVRGNAKIHFPMKFTRIEPYILPKTSFTGDSIERIDTRVLQVLYRFEKENMPLYPGQLLDVYIEAPSLDEKMRRP